MQRWIGLIIGVSGFVYLCFLNWKIALCIFLMFWGNNLAIEDAVQ